MDGRSPAPSPDLLAANQRLLELCEQTQAKKPPIVHPEPQPSPFDDVSPCLLAEMVTQLPPHLGWSSQPATQAIRASLTRCTSEASDLAPSQVIESATASKPPASSGNGVTDPRSWRTLGDNVVKHYPSLGVGALQIGWVPVYRVWLLCRYLDRDGRGWLPLDDVRQKLTDKQSDLRLFDWRRLQQILAQGHGRFWKWDKGNGRLWLFGAANVAANLHVTQLVGKPVALPLSAITSSIGECKAHLYGAWHSGRKENKPISRKVQESLTGVPERTQRHYCHVADIGRQSNIAIGGRLSCETVEQAAWQHGRATFSFTDYEGRQGRKGSTYVAWRLPNSYSNLHRQTSIGRMRKINWKLHDLVTKGAQGNEQTKVEKLYYGNGKEAAWAVSRGKGEEAYWPMQVKAQDEKLWAVFAS